METVRSAERGLGGRAGAGAGAQETRGRVSVLPVTLALRSLAGRTSGVWAARRTPSPSGSDTQLPPQIPRTPWRFQDSFRLSSSGPSEVVLRLSCERRAGGGSPLAGITWPWLSKCDRCDPWQEGHLKDSHCLKVSDELTFP